MDYTVSEVARLAGVSVRTLHHYDELGLLRPDGRSEAGYRLYQERDLERLQQILFFRELGFPLHEIGRLLDAEGFDRVAALRLQRGLLEERSHRLQNMIRAVDRALAAHEGGRAMETHELFDGFGDFDPEQYQDEVKQRWGDSEQYRESARRTKRYGKEEWKRIREEADGLYRQLAEQLGAGAPPDAPEVLELAEAHRLHLERWFYPCPRSFHRGLGELYVADPRFTENLDRVRPGLAAFLRDAFRANEARDR